MHTPRPVVWFVGLTVIVVSAGSALLQSQPASPPPPDKYKIAIRYHILAPRDQHVASYKTMIDDLNRIGFDFQPPLKPFPNTDYEDPNKNTLSGFIAKDEALRPLANQSIASILLMPANYQLPDDPLTPVRVRLELAGGFPSSRQFTLANQVKALLRLIDFKESAGYDHRGYTKKPFTRIVGTIPAENLMTLLKDLRTQPTGWLTPLVETDTLPAPINSVVPIIVTEVVPETAPAKDTAQAPKRGQEYLDKISSDLWALVTNKDDDTKIVRAEVILSYVPNVDDESYRQILTKEAPSLLIEGRLGPVVSVLLRANQASGLAGLPQVSVIRLARPALVQVDPSVSVAGDNVQALSLSGLTDYHQRGFQGQGIRVGIIDSDFRGFENQVKSGKLPKTTRLLDLTAEFNSDLLPDPQLGDEKVLGHGTHCALAFALAAPQSELTLIRIDSALLLQIQQVAKVVNGEEVLNEHLIRRADELRAAAQVLASRRDEIIQEREAVLSNYEDDSEYKRLYDILGPDVRGWLFTPREWHYRRVQELERDSEVQRQVERRFYRLFEDLKNLKGLNIVGTSLVWNDGYPLGGGSPLSQWFDAIEGRKAMWFTSVGNTRGQTWLGTYRDVDGNGVMEFAQPGTPLPAGLWSLELGFLAWQPYIGTLSQELPEGAKVRISIQWQEPHDPSYFWNPNERDRYLKPLADLSLTVLRQRDPSGKTMSADDFELVARSPVPAFRIENRRSGSTYEQIVEFTAPKAGRYAFQVERQLPTKWELQIDPRTGQLVLVELKGLASTGIRPADAPTLPAVESHWELRPRIFVGSADSVTAGKGRIVFRDFATTQGSIPILADTRKIISVGAANFAGSQQPYSASGTPGTLWNFFKPNMLTFDGLALTPPGTGSAFGTSLATPFAAGTAATMLSSGIRQYQLEAQLQSMRCKTWQPGHQ